MANKTNDFVPYKEKELKVYASNEWLAENQRKYRTVYDRGETTYLWAEYSFYNKLFDEEDWEFSCQFKALATDGREICSIDVKRTIGKDQNIVYIREGWGMDKPGAFWKKGTYRWEVWIGEKKVSSVTFYVTDIGRVTDTENPFFKIKSVRLYEASYNNVGEDERTYYKEFRREDTRYVWAEFKADNALPNEVDWPAELFFNYYSDTGELKGTVQELLIVGKGQEQITATVGWGSDKTGSWFHDDYKLEIVFMDRVVGVIPFKVTDEFVETSGTSQLLLPEGLLSVPTIAPSESLEETLGRLEEMIGLQSIKTKIREYTTYLNFLKLRKEKGIDDDTAINLHSVFIGNPGTGKTTVAMMLGQIYKNMGLLTRGHVHSVDRAELVGEFIGQTAPKVKKAIKAARGGILFIDEAYSLARKGDDNKDFGREVIEILLKELSDGEGNLAVILAGYPEEMDTFLTSNPGLKSRLSQQFHFPDYTPQELLAIADFAAKQRKVELAVPARDYLYDQLVRLYRDRDRAFGNARLVNHLLDAAKMNMGLRLMKATNLAELTQNELTLITQEDFERVFQLEKGVKPILPVDQDLLKKAQEELHQLVGLDIVKREVGELIQLCQFYRDLGKDITEEFNLHTIFTGNPGTGKTTVARILANVYKAVGILERGHLVEADRQKLVASFLGQTAEKTDALIQQAMGGVLFIDEAYTLYTGEGDTYGKEAIATLLKRMEDHRRDFVVIAAGYPDDMKRFLESNPGLKSRFDRTIHFQDYTAEQMMSIARSMFAADEVEMDAGAEAKVQAYVEALNKAKDKFFGNARTVRRMAEKAVKNQHLRLAKLSAADRTPELIRTITEADVLEFDASMAKSEAREPVGFRLNPEGSKKDAPVADNPAPSAN